MNKTPALLAALCSFACLSLGIVALRLHRGTGDQATLAGPHLLRPASFLAFSQATALAHRWPDRRPIGSLVLATAATGWKHNPRGWLLDPAIDVGTKSGVMDFERRLMGWADNSIRVLQAMNAQGMISWDIEGEEFPHTTTYIGDPRLAETLAPEMKGVLDRYFRRFRNAGLRAGITIRPQQLTTAFSSGKPPQQLSVADAADILTQKIAYARSRWGATLFYIDSNGDPALPLSFEPIRKVAEKFPDVLLIPEHNNAAYFAETAPYSQLRDGIASTPALVRQIYPDAFSVIDTANGDLARYHAELVNAVAQGDILLFRAWFDDPNNIKLKQVMAEAARLRGNVN